MKNMKVLLGFAVLVAVIGAALGKFSPPKVQVYSKEPGEFGKDNTLLCRVSEFHPPDIRISLMKDAVDLGGNQTDLAFRQDWRFHLTKHVAFKPSEGEKYSCRVIHGSDIKDYAWEPNM